MYGPDAIQPKPGEPSWVHRGALWTADQIPDQTSRTFIVTGANSGLGYETTRQLALRGAHVIMTARNETKGHDALAKLTAGQPGASLELRLLDLSDLDSVRALAEGVIADRVQVDVLINNAGIMMPPRSLTKQGFELQFGTNHLLFGLELDRRLRASGSEVRSVLAHPGYSATNLQSNGPTGLLNLLMKISNPIMAQHVSMGALDQLYAATDPNAEGGQFIGPDRLAENRGHPKVVQPVGSAKDPETARRLWEVSEELTDVRFRLPALA